MLDSILKNAVWGAFIGLIVGAIVGVIVDLIAKSKTVDRLSAEGMKTLSGFIEVPILSSAVGKLGSVYANDTSLDFTIGTKFGKPNKFSVPYDKVRKFEFCGEFISTDTPPKIEDIPDRFIVEYETEDGTLMQLSFMQPYNIKGGNRDALYPNNIFDYVHSRMDKYQDTSALPSSMEEEPIDKI